MTLNAFIKELGYELDRAKMDSDKLEPQNFWRDGSLRFGEIGVPLQEQQQQQQQQQKGQHRNGSSSIHVYIAVGATAV